MVRTDQFVTVDGIEIHYSEWGGPQKDPVVCVHGLSRVGRDFDPLAATLEDEYYVVCPDMPGRGWSEWPEDSTAYTNTAMMDLLVSFCDELGFESVRWVGTSMGGILGMRLAAGALADRISHLVVNDISPSPAAHAEPEALQRIGTYVGDPPVCDTVAELEAYYRECYGGQYSEMTDREWRRFTVTSARRTDDGRVTRNYDPRLLEAPGADEADPDDPWKIWEEIDTAVLVIRGSDSDILPRDVFSEMLERRPDAASLTVECGHAPALNVPEQTEPIREFFAR